MISRNEILSTIQMIDRQHLDVRTITMGISLLSCADPDPERACGKIYEKITRYAEHLVRVGEEIESEFGIPIVNKRISVTPIALVAAPSETDSYVCFAETLDRAGKTCGVIIVSVLKLTHEQAHVTFQAHQTAPFSIPARLWNGIFPGTGQPPAQLRGHHLQC